MVTTFRFHMNRLYMSIMMTAVCLTSWATSILTNDEVKNATSVLKSSADNGEKKRAFGILTNAAEKDSCAYAMNVLGIAYLNGIVGTPDTTEAVNWLTMAAENGYTDSYHNLGVIYKNGLGGIRQDFHKSYEYFSLGCNMKAPQCFYDKGYMLYKGLGCRQNYEEAMECFAIGVNADHSPSLYMYGLCLRNGYGCEQDTAKATFYIRRAALLGHKEALHELNIANPENSFFETVPQDSIFGNVPHSMPSGITSAGDNEHLDGDYDGVLVLYDWSGKFIIGEKYVKISFRRNCRELSGVFYVNGDSVTYRAKLSEDGRLLFRNGTITLHERYTSSDSANVRYRIEDAIFDVSGEKITGKLGLYNLMQGEPERPMLLELWKRDDAIIAKKDSVSSWLASISPNPFDTQFNVNVRLEKEERVNIRIYNQYGALVYHMPAGIIERGEHVLNVCPNINYGTYILNVSAGQQVFRTIIVKKGGAK